MIKNKFYDKLTLNEFEGNSVNLEFKMCSSESV